MIFGTCQVVISKYAISNFERKHAVYRRHLLNKNYSKQNKAETNTDVTNGLYNCIVNEYTDTVNESNEFLYRATFKKGRRW